MTDTVILDGDEKTVIKNRLIMSTNKKGYRIWVEHDPSDNKVWGFAQPLTNKVGLNQANAKRAFLGIGDEGFAFKVAKDFQKNALKAIGNKKRRKSPLAR